MPFRTLQDLVADAKRTVTEIDCDELVELLDPANDSPDLVVIDVREADERGRGYIPGSVGISRGVLERDVAKAFGGAVREEDLARPVVLYCGGGSRSALAAASLQAMGFRNVQSLAGGFGAWGKTGRAIEHPRGHA